MWIVVLLILAVIFTGIYVACRPVTFYDEPVQSRGRYIVFNKLTGYPAFNGQTFRSPKSAERKIRKTSGWVHPLLEVRIVL